MAHKTLIDGTAYSISGGKALVDGTAYSIKNGKTLVGGTAYGIEFGAPIGYIGNLAVGSSVFLNVNGASTEFIIVHQGLPSSMYDSSCNGTWLLMKDAYETRVWHSSNNNSYGDSTIHTYLNGDFLGLFDNDIQSAIKQVKIPYHNGVGNSGNIASGSSGLSAKIFLLSGYEAGWTQSVATTYLPIDGACLSYFSGTAKTDSKRIAYLDGAATGWWLRSPYTSYTSNAFKVDKTGYYASRGCKYAEGIRPALILPSDTIL